MPGFRCFPHLPSSGKSRTSGQCHLVRTPRQVSGSFSWKMVILWDIRIISPVLTSNEATVNGIVPDRWRSSPGRARLRAAMRQHAQPGFSCTGANQTSSRPRPLIAIFIINLLFKYSKELSHCYDKRLCHRYQSLSVCQTWCKIELRKLHLQLNVSIILS
jgi:hypothetical protein